MSSDGFQPYSWTVLAAGGSVNPNVPSSIKWIRQSDGAVIATFYAYENASGDGLSMNLTPPPGNAAQVFLGASMQDQSSSGIVCEGQDGQLAAVYAQATDAQFQPSLFKRKLVDSLGNSDFARVGPLSWVGLPFATGAGTGNWSNFGGGWTPAEYAKDDLGLVHLHGMVKNGTAVTYPNTNTLIGTLPTGYRPGSHIMTFATFDDSAGHVGIAGLQILTDGRVMLTGSDQATANPAGNNGSFTWLAFHVVPFQQVN